MNLTLLSLIYFFVFSTICICQEEDKDSTNAKDVVNSLLGFLSPKVGVVAKVDAEFYDEYNSTEHSFNVTAFKIYLKGNSGDKFSYSFYGDFTNQYNLLDLKFTYKLNNDIKFDVGKFKTPFGAEFLLLDAKLPFVNRSMMATNLGPQRQVGLSAEGYFFQKRVTLCAGFFNGSRYYNERPKISLFTGSIHTVPLNIEKEQHSIKFEVGASLASGYQEGDLISPFNGESNRFCFGINSRLCYNNFWLAGEYIGMHNDFGSNPIGFYIDLGTAITDKLEIIGRIEYYMYQNLYYGTMYMPQSIINRNYWLGINSYPLDNIKLQLNIARNFSYYQT